MKPVTRDEDESTATDARGWLEMSDAELLKQCAVDLYRASGPGGQKRNKTSSAVRLRHAPTGRAVVATESRSQHQNKTSALRRLRGAIALQCRNQVDPSGPAPEFYRAALARDPALRVGCKHDDYWLIIQHVLDVFSRCRAAAGDASAVLGLSTGHLVRFLKKDDKLWAEANRMRADFGHPALR